MTNFSYVVKNSQEFDAFDFDEIFYQQKANFPCFFIKANLSRTRNLNCYLLFKLYFQSFSFLNFWNFLVVFELADSLSILGRKVYLKHHSTFPQNRENVGKVYKKSIFKDGKVNLIPFFVLTKHSVTVV